MQITIIGAGKVAGLTGFRMFDFQRMRRSQDISSAPLPAASIFLDILKVFLFFLQIFTRDEQPTRIR